MPEISRFLGISILMYFEDHNPPHFHVRYNNFRAIISIIDLKIMDGYLLVTATLIIRHFAMVR